MTTFMTTCGTPLPPPSNARGPWFGWSISLLVHACVLAWLVHSWPTHPPDAAPAERMHFVLVPATPQAKVTEPAPARVASVPAPKEAAAQARPARSRPAPSVPAPAAASSDAGERTAPAEPAAAIVPDAPVTATPAEPAPTAAEQDSPDAGANASDAAPHLDVKAARATARLIEKHRKDGLVAFPKPDPPLKRDDRLERAIERAHRSKDCKTAYSAMGLLALIPLAKDTLTGTGCRW